MFKKTDIREKERHYTVIKGSIKQGDTMFVNIYASSMGAPKYIKQILTDIKGEIGSNIRIVGILTPHLHQWIDHTDRKSIRKLWP